MGVVQALNIEARKFEVSDAENDAKSACRCSLSQGLVLRIK